MPQTRRAFLKTAALGTATLPALGFDLTPLHAQVRQLKIARTRETRSTCPYCSVSCGVIVHTLGDGAQNVKGTVVQPRYAVPEGRHPRAQRGERPAPHPRAVPRRGVTVGRRARGTGPSTASLG
jgi:anaerobic selenocysteine-containing dehydrogenase